MVSSHSLLRLPRQSPPARKTRPMPPTARHGRSGNSFRATVTQDYRDRYEKLTGTSLRQCPFCHRGHMIAVGEIERPKDRRQSRTPHEPHHRPAPNHELPPVRFSRLPRGILNSAAPQLSAVASIPTKPAFHSSPLPRLHCKTDQTPSLGGSRFFIQDPVTHSIPIGGCRGAV